MDPFAILPSPLLEMILKFLPDLTSLHSLQNASPAVALLLHEDSITAEIVETIFSQSRKVYGIPPIIQRIIRIIVLLHSRPAGEDVDITSDAAVDETPVPSMWNIFTDRSNYGVECLTARGISRPPNYGDDPLPRCTPSSILCCILALSARIRHLSHRCIHEMIARCMASKPSHLKDPRFHLRRKVESEKDPERPPGRPYEPRDVGGPSWVEEQRVTRGLWWITLFFTLRDGGAAVLGWSLKEQERLKGLTAFNFWRELIMGPDLLDTQTVEMWIHGAGLKMEGRCERLPTCKVSFSANEKEHVWCCKAYRPWVKGYDTKTEVPYIHCVRYNYLDYYAPGYVFCSDNKHMAYISFQPYGFGFWDFERMRALGFLDTYSDSNKSLSLCNAIFTWESIINEEQLKEAEARQRSDGQTGYFIEEITILDKPKD